MDKINATLMAVQSFLFAAGLFFIVIGGFMWLLSYKLFSIASQK